MPNSNHGAEAASYMMGHSTEEALRLDSQHAFIRRALGGQLLATQIQNACRAGEIKRILDVGTGTGIWCYDTAAEIRKLGVTEPITIIGTDIAESEHWKRHRVGSSGATNGTKEVFQTTVDFDIVDFNDDLEMLSILEKHGGPFDLIHHRFLFSSIKKEKWPAYVERISKLLRPGGYIQIQEADTYATLNCVDDQVAAEATLAVTVIYRGMGLYHEIRQDLAVMLRRAKFNHVREEEMYVQFGVQNADGSVSVDELNYEWGRNVFIALKSAYLNFRAAPNYQDLIVDLLPHVYRNAPEGKPELLLKDEAAYDDFQRRLDKVMRTDPLWHNCFCTFIARSPE